VFRAVILSGLYKKDAHLVKSSLGQLSKWIVGVALVLLLLTPGGAGLAARKADIGSDPAAGGGIAHSPTASNGSHWLRIRLNLSGSPNVVSGYPDLAMSSDGIYVAVVWTEGYDSSLGAKHHGRVYLRWISEDTGNWSSKIPVIPNYYPSANDWATDAVITLQGTTAHIVFVRYQDLLSRYGIWYTSCALNPLGTTCNSPSALQTGSGALASPDIAVDGSGNVFVAYSRESGSYRQIQYFEFNGTTWSGPEQASTDNTVNDWPAVAVQGSTVHVAWIRTIISTQASVAYRQRPVGGSWSASPDYPYTTSWSRYPHMTSGGSTLYLAWQTSQSGNYQVNYKYDTGSGWQPPLLNERKGITSTTSLYGASTSGDEYLQYLRPALAVDNEGHLHAVWHHYDGELGGTLLHRVLYSHSENPKAATPTWDEPVVFAELSGNEDLTPEERHFPVDNVAARIAVGPPRGTEIKEHVHVVLMAKTGTAWDVWYLSNQLYKEVFLPTAAKN
jgi:hypothetical protein